MKHIFERHSRERGQRLQDELAVRGTPPCSGMMAEDFFFLGRRAGEVVTLSVTVGQEPRGRFRC